MLEGDGERRPPARSATRRAAVTRRLRHTAERKRPRRCESQLRPIDQSTGCEWPRFESRRTHALRDDLQP
eukprot:1203192-Prymnesium_polylepis.1